MAKLKSAFHKQIAEFGRTMLEMLGVLAIICLLTIGGIYFYNKAVDSNKSDRVYEDIMVAASAHSNRGTVRTTKGIADIRTSSMWGTIFT